LSFMLAYAAGAIMTEFNWHVTASGVVVAATPK
jgi:hypothetical protein